MPRIVARKPVDVEAISDDEGQDGFQKDKSAVVKGAARRNFGIKADAVAEELKADQIDVTDDKLEFRGWNVGQKLKRKHFHETTSAELRKTLFESYGNGSEEVGKAVLAGVLASMKKAGDEKADDEDKDEAAPEAEKKDDEAAPEAAEAPSADAAEAADKVGSLPFPEGSTLEELTEKIGGVPDVSSRPGDWLLYQVQRIRYADESVSALEFSQVELPLVKDELLLLPALLHAAKTLKKKCNLDKIAANSCRINRESGLVLAEIVRVCKSLTRLSLEKNDLDIVACKALAESLKTCKRLEELKLSQQSQINADARAMEVAFAEAMETNETVCRLGIVLKDPSSRNKIDTATVRNGELRRKRIKKEKKRAERKARGEASDSSDAEY